MSFLSFQASPAQAVAVLSLLIVIYATSKIVYNLFLHPLAKYPGPKLAAITNLWHAIHWTSGRYPWHIAALHAKYGPIVRTAPNELSFGGAETYKQIYGHTSKTHRPFLKGEFYAADPSQASSIVRERDPKRHEDMRRSLSHAFSAKSLRLQQDLILHYVELFVQQLTRLGNQGNGLEMDEWYNWLTFDILGDLAFGEPFGAVADAKPNFWIRAVCEGINAGSIYSIMNRIPLLKPLLNLKYSDSIKQREKLYAMSKEKLKGRLAKDNTRDDYFAHILSDPHKGFHQSEDVLLSQAMVLIVAGSETTSTFLSGATYFLTKTPTAFNRFALEIRSAFNTSEQITAESVGQLPYLTAVIEEGLRIHGPLAFGLPRISPGAEVGGEFIPAGTGVSTCPWTTQHSPKYWFEPDEYHPERWLPVGHEHSDVRFAGDIKEAFKPFSLGPRGCLGINQAYLEMRLILAKLIWHFDWELMSKDLDFMRDVQFFTLWKKPTLMVKFTPVERTV